MSKETEDQLEILDSQVDSKQRNWMALTRESVYDVIRGNVQNCRIDIKKK